jgi:membrane fusion protein, copper/silver efflux system
MKWFVIVLAIALAFAAGKWYAGRPAPRAGGSPDRVLYWVDPMHPWYKFDKPGIAPDCGMKLVPVHAGEEAQYQAREKDMVRISPEKQQLIGVEYGSAEYETTSETIQAAARVTLDETRITKIQPRVEGWISQVFADFTGKYVKKGDPLLTLYSPDALATEQEYLLALKAQHTMHASMPGMQESNTNLVAAARRRLELWDIPAPQIDEIGRNGKTLDDLTLVSPASGFITERNAYNKQHVTPETVLYTLADLSSVWVIADVFEYEAAGVRLGQAASMTLDYLPGRAFHGRVSYILPQVDAATRTLKVRIAFDNPGGALKPDMYCQVTLAGGAARRLVVPRSAVLDSGERQTVFLDRGNGNFEPRQVKTGQQVGDRVEILSGLSAGERIVTSGNFLIDSESQLKAAMNGMAK